MKLKKGPAKIFLADDDSMVRMMVSRILEMFGHQVVTASSGKELLENVDDSFDVIVLDINMPDMDGFATMDKLNGLQFDIPVLFLTGAGTMDYAVKAIHLGAYDFLTKPIEVNKLFATLKA
ncbi:MAG: response regulator, partial [Desulforhopalus sp.]